VTFASCPTGPATVRVGGLRERRHQWKTATMLGTDPAKHLCRTIRRRPPPSHVGLSHTKNGESVVRTLSATGPDFRRPHGMSDDVLRGTELETEPVALQ